MPAGIQDMEQMNWLNSQKGLFPYRWSLYSGGHANLDLNKQDWSEDMVRNRDPNTLMLGDSGGFQIAKGLWEGDWKANSGCKKAEAKRKAVLTWLDSVSDYCMTLDIPTWVIHDQKASDACQIKTLQQAIDATKYNNEYFMTNRKGKANGGTKILNVLQGDNHKNADDWYEIMKEYCDPKKYPDTHFDGWAMGGQNMCYVHLILHRLVTLRHDGLLQEGVHDWMHFLGTSKLEWAVLLTDIQRAVRKYVNPSFAATANAEAQSPSPVGYTIALSYGPTTSSVTAISPNDYQFDYKSGVIQFLTSPPGTPVYLTGYRYVGRTLADNATLGTSGSFSGSFQGSSTLNNLTLTGSFNHTGSYNLIGNITQTGSLNQSGSINVVGPIISNGINVVDNAIAMAIALG
jgi:hypothetical protein